MIRDILPKVRKYIDQRRAVDEEYNSKIDSIKDYNQNAFLEKATHFQSEANEKENIAFAEFESIYTDIKEAREAVEGVTVKPMSEDVKRTIDTYAEMGKLKENQPALEKICEKSFLAFKYLDFKLGVDNPVRNEHYRDYNIIKENLDYVENTFRRGFSKYGRFFWGAGNGHIKPFNTFDSYQISLMYKGKVLNELADGIESFINYFG